MIKAVIACGARKAETACPAGELYTSTYHRKGLAWLRTRFADDEILILSSRHGFIGLNDIIEPYEQTWKQPGAIDQTSLSIQASRLTWADPITVIGGTAYADKVRALNKVVVRPFAGLAIGKQMAAMSL